MSSLGGGREAPKGRAVDDGRRVCYKSNVWLVIRTFFHPAGGALSTLGRFSHIGILVRDLAAATERFRTSLGARLVETGHLADSNTDVAVLELGGLHLELLSSSQPDSKVGRLLREHGDGVHHLSFEVDDIRRRLAELRDNGMQLRDEVPRSGLHGRLIAFLDPGATSGILIELAEENRQSKEND